MSGLCTASKPSPRYSGGGLDALVVALGGALSVDVAESDAVIIVR